MKLRSGHQRQSAPVMSTRKDKVCPSLGITSYNAAPPPHAETLARLSVCAISPSVPLYPALLSHFFRPQFALPHTDGPFHGAAASARNPLPFLYRPKTLDRDSIVVPAPAG
jgi:hypothetical protein